MARASDDLILTEQELLDKTVRTLSLNVFACDQKGLTTRTSGVVVWHIALTASQSKLRRRITFALSVFFLDVPM